MIKNNITNMFLSPLDFFQNSFMLYSLVYFPYIRPENLKYSSLSRLSDCFNWLATFFCSTPVFSSCVLVFCVVASFMYIYIFAIFCYRFSPIIYGWGEGQRLVRVWFFRKCWPLLGLYDIDTLFVGYIYAWQTVRFFFGMYG